MSNTKQNGAPAQGAEAPKPLTQQQVTEFVKNDLAVCINLLDAIYRDQPTIDMIGEILYGRYMNAMHKEELSKQTEVDFKNG